VNDVDSMLAFARRFVAAIEAKDIDAVRQSYRPDALIWHNTDGKFQSVEQSIRGVYWIHKVLAGVHYEIKRLQPFPGGYLQEHVLRGTLPSDESFAMPACVVCKVEEGRIVSLDEYLDSVHALPLVSQSKTAG